MSQITTPGICPGSGEFVDEGQVDGDGVTHCPVCDATTLAEPVPTPDDVATAYWAVWVHPPRAAKPLGHLPLCRDEDGKLECCCGLTEHLEGRQ